MNAAHLNQSSVARTTAHAALSLEHSRSYLTRPAANAPSNKISLVVTQELDPAAQRILSTTAQAWTTPLTPSIKHDRAA